MNLSLFNRRLAVRRVSEATTDKYNEPVWTNVAIIYRNGRVEQKITVIKDTEGQEAVGSFKVFFPGDESIQVHDEIEIDSVWREVLEVKKNPGRSAVELTTVVVR